jgi:hypothetical protein
MKREPRFKCPPRLPKGPHGKAAPTKPCWRIEKVSQDGRTGYATVFYDARTGKPIGYGKGYLTTGRNIQETCGVTKDPFRASVKDRSLAALDGELCIQFSKPKKARKQKKRRP